MEETISVLSWMLFPLPGCVRPFLIQHGSVHLAEPARGTIPVGTVLQYSCDPGYLADGPSTITCSPLGLWSADAPRCIRSDGEALSSHASLEPGL